MPQLLHGVPGQVRPGSSSRTYLFEVFPRTAYRMVALGSIDWWAFEINEFLTMPLCQTRSIIIYAFPLLLLLMPVIIFPLLPFEALTSVLGCSPLLQFFSTWYA